MYWEWAALSLNGSNTNTGSGESSERKSVLERLPPEAAKDVVAPVVRHVVTTLGISQPPQPSEFTNDAEIEWALQVICFGLSLPLSDHEIIKDCVNIYCEWLSCLAPIPKISVPKPIMDRPNFFARKMINHLYHLFTPRKGEVWPFFYQEDLVQDTINRQAVLCHRALRTLQNIVKTSEILESQTWECILLFFIAINNALLSPPTIKDDIGDQLCERVLSALFEVWLLACGKSFPSPSLWKTLRETCRLWRHRPNLFDQWNRINLLLTSHVLKIMYGENYIKIEEDPNLISTDMSNDCMVQTWFRFLHCLGSPVELTQPTLISQTQNFLQFAISSKQVIDPCQHPCLLSLPSIFQQAMKGVAVLVDSFLGISPTKLSKAPSAEKQPIPSPVPPLRRLAKSFSVSQSSNIHRGLSKTSLLGLSSTSGNRSKDTTSIPTTSTSSIQTTQSSASLSSLDQSPFLRIAFSDSRPKVNSILHLYGPWLFEAALINPSTSVPDTEIRRRSRGSIPAALPESYDIPLAITIDKYYEGRAEALGSLCRIFCSKKTGEEILPAYLARFFLAIRNGLMDNRIEVVNSILSNSSNLMRIDLDGVSMLTPIIVSALEIILPSKDALKSDLRRSAIQLLLSLLPFPLHFLKLPVKDIADRTGPTSTFLQLKPRLANLLINSLQVETDSANIQMLLGGLFLFVVDTSLFEETDITHSNLGTDSPTNLLSSENTSTRSLSEFGNSFDEYTLGLSESSDSQLDTAHALFVRTTYLVCHRLISTWKTDLPVSLAAVELLNGLARTKVQDQDPLECRRAVKWICDFIIHQCSRPPPAHSKDLHSIIVAAFNCVTNWLTEHPDILEDKDTITTVLEVVEYGISGTKSQGKPGEPTKLKDEKELKPVSLRVRDAAESLLAVIFEQVGPVGRASSEIERCSLSVDETSILNALNSNTDRIVTREEIIKNFRYFVIDNTILAGFFEEPTGSDSENPPTITMLLRGPTGRHAWTLQLRRLPIHKEKSFSTVVSNPGRPLPMTDLGTRCDIQHRYFPASIDGIALCKADKAIPQLNNKEDGSPSNNESLEESRLSIILENQIQLEKSIANLLREESDESYPNMRTECAPPPIAQEFQTARLLLSHLGLISYITGNEFIPPKLAGIDSKHPDFVRELDVLDGTSCRTYDTVHIFYVRAGQKKSNEILANVQSRNNVHPHFMEFLLSLGWPVNLNAHNGWTGHVNTSWSRLNQYNLKESSSGTSKSIGSKANDIPHGGSLYDGEKQVLYWADVSSEIAFVVPTGKPAHCRSDATVWSKSGSASLDTADNRVEDKKTSIDHRLQRSQTEDHAKDLSAATSKKPHVTKTCETKIFVVWLESFEDSTQFPVGELLNFTDTGLESSSTPPTLIIFIHALKNGLFRVHMVGEPLRMGLALPLIDGMVISRRAAGNLVRQTVLNMSRRKRLENEISQPPYVRRKQKIQEILHKFPRVMSEQDFYTDLFTNPESIG